MLHLSKHMNGCLKRTLHSKKQQLFNFQPNNTTVNANLPALAPTIVNGKYDLMMMKEATCHWVLMHEHHFSIVEKGGFNFMMNVVIP